MAFRAMLVLLGATSVIFCKSKSYIFAIGKKRREAAFFYGLLKYRRLCN